MARRKPKVFSAGDKVKSRNTGFTYVVIGPTDRGTHGVYQFYAVKSLDSSYTTSFPLKEIEPA